MIYLSNNFVYYSRNESKILSADQATTLKNLLGFQTKTFNLIYRATRDGFCGIFFNYKVFGISKTLTIVKTTKGNIFGGYASETFSLFSYKSDNNAFIFSLVNPQNKSPYKIMVTPSSSKAIYTDNTNAPNFGTDNLCIFCNSNMNQDSRNNLQDDYPNPNGYMDGEYYFKIVEIEVYQVL